MDIAALAISAVSLLIAVASFILSLKPQRLQNKVNELEIRLKQREIEESEKKKEPCIEARIVPVSGNDYMVKVWNSGTAVARNITASWEKAENIFCADLKKMPFEFLNPQKNFDLTISVFGINPGKLCVQTSWEDENGNKFSNKQWCSL